MPLGLQRRSLQLTRSLPHPVGTNLHVGRFSPLYQLCWLLHFWRTPPSSLQQRLGLLGEQVQIRPGFHPPSRLRYDVPRHSLHQPPPPSCHDAPQVPPGSCPQEAQLSIQVPLPSQSQPFRQGELKGTVQVQEPWP